MVFYCPVIAYLSDCFKPWTAACKKLLAPKILKYFSFFFLAALNRHEENKLIYFLRALGSSWKHVTLRFDLSRKSEQLDWLRVWLNSRLRLKVFSSSPYWTARKKLLFCFFMSPEPPWKKESLTVMGCAIVLRRTHCEVWRDLHVTWLYRSDTSVINRRRFFDGPNFTFSHQSN